VGHALCNSGVIVPPPTAYSGAGMGWQVSIGNEPDHVVQGGYTARHLAAWWLAFLDFLRPNGNAKITKMVFLSPSDYITSGWIFVSQIVFSLQNSNNRFFIFYTLP